MRIPSVGIADIARKQWRFVSGFSHHLFGNRQGVALQRLEPIFFADQPQFFPVTIIGERLDHIGARPQKLPVQCHYCFGMIQHHLGHIGTGLQITTALEFKEVAFSTNDRSIAEPLHQAASDLGESGMISSFIYDFGHIRFQA